ncbi:hypothetical protein [Chromobacterium sp. CV08]|uniref:hypothetical protein n=1 Tax=Chromobacterium sp. CV08 TaxID=3133274 RepID=UPI003DAA2831
MEKKIEITASHVANRILIAIHIDRVRSFLLDLDVQLRKQDICQAAYRAERARLIPCHSSKEEIDKIIQNKIIGALQEIVFLARSVNLPVVSQESEKAMLACQENNPKMIRQALLDLIKALEKEIS